MKANQERLEFSQRLSQAMQSADYAPNSPTQLAREFNSRFEGSAVTVHAARKWLQGESIPTQEKLRALAAWLNVPADWLRFGSLDECASGEASTASKTFDASVLSLIQQLDEYHRKLALELLRGLVKVSKKK
jgi:transcriptional regulator with XRE-family HTH domain